jgi:hypothetical protein
MERQHCRQVNRCEHIAVEHHDGLATCLTGCKLDGAAGPERCWFHHVPEVNSEVGAVAEHLFDAPRLVVQAQDDFVDFRHLTQQVDLVAQERAVENRNDRFWCVERQRPKPRPLATGEEDCLHVNRAS